MKNLLLHFAETPDQPDIDTGIVEYDPQLNLNVIRGTQTPAVNLSELATETLTKANGEGVSDSDKDFNNLGILMGTTTETRRHQEASDDDKAYRQMQQLVATETITESTETVDSDK